MIASFQHKGLRRFFETGSVAGIQPAHAKRLSTLLGLLNAASEAADMDLPGLRFHALKGFRPTRWSVQVSGNWRLTFELSNGNAHVVDYEDYH